MLHSTPLRLLRVLCTCLRCTALLAGPTVLQQTFRVRSAVACCDTARTSAASTESTHNVLRAQQHLRSVVACLVTACTVSTQSTHCEHSRFRLCVLIVPRRAFAAVLAPSLCSSLQWQCCAVSTQSMVRCIIRAGSPRPGRVVREGVRRIQWVHGRLAKCRPPHLHAARLYDVGARRVGRRRRGPVHSGYGTEAPIRASGSA